MQTEECSQEDLETLLNLEARDWESQQEENSFWLTTLVAGYSARYYRLVSTPPLLSPFLRLTACWLNPCAWLLNHLFFLSMLKIQHHGGWGYMAMGGQQVVRTWQWHAIQRATRSERRSCHTPLHYPHVYKIGVVNFLE